MPIDPLHSLLVHTPPQLVDYLDTILESQRSSDVYARPDGTVSKNKQAGGRQSLTLVSQCNDPRRGSTEELKERLQVLAGRGKVHAMQALSPYLASLTVEMLGGHQRAARALSQLYSHETVWTDLVQAIFHASDDLMRLAEAKNVRLFGEIVEEMYAAMPQRLAHLLLEREDDVLMPEFVAERVGAWSWGPFEVARALFDVRFGQDTSPHVRRVRGNHLLPVLKAMEAMARGMSPVDLLSLASSAHRFRKEHTRPRDQAIDVVMSLASTLGGVGIFPRVSIPAELAFAQGCPAEQLQYVLIELLINASKFTDPQKPIHTVSIVWDGRQHAIVVRDNGIGIQHVHDVWPDSIDESNAFGPGIAMRGSLFRARNRLQRMTARMTLASEFGKWTEFKIYPRLGDIQDARETSPLQPPSGPPVYGDEQVPGIAAANDGPVSVDASTRLYSSAALPAVANFFPLRSLLP